MSNKLIIAAAGSGKTTFLVKQALSIHDGRVLITTFTEANEQEINKKFIAVSLIMVAFMVVWRLFLREHVIISIVVACMVTCIYVLMYRGDLKNLMKAVKRKKS